METSVVISGVVVLLCAIGYVPLSRTKIDFSSDLEKTDPNQKKKKKKKVCPLYIHMSMNTNACLY